MISEVGEITNTVGILFTFLLKPLFMISLIFNILAAIEVLTKPFTGIITEIASRLSEYIVPLILSAIIWRGINTIIGIELMERATDGEITDNEILKWMDHSNIDTSLKSGIVELLIAIKVKSSNKLKWISGIAYALLGLLITVSSTLVAKGLLLLLIDIFGLGLVLKGVNDFRKSPEEKTKSVFAPLSYKVSYMAGVASLIGTILQVISHIPVYSE